MTTKVSDASRGSAGSLATRREPVPAIEELKEDLKNLTFQLNQNKNKDKRESVWCTTCMTEGHHKNECPTFAQYMATGMTNPLPQGGLWCEI
jgi:hypothetical protein